MKHAPARHCCTPRRDEQKVTGKPLERGFDECARICLTHSFPIKHVDAFASSWDCPPEEREVVQHYLESGEYTAYDRLVQLCDALALPSGPCVIEKRLVDVALRHGFNALTVSKWQAILALEQDFSTALGASIYTVLPGVVENTFGFNIGQDVIEKDVPFLR